MSLTATRRASEQLVELPPVLLPYQQRWVDDRSPVKVCVKSRRIGITWATAYEAVECASLSAACGGSDFWYQVYAEDDAKEFIEACADWARAFESVFTLSVDELHGEDARASYVLKDGEKSIRVFTIRFRSGFKIVGLAHSPRKLRGKQGVYCLDEAAYHDNPEAALIAANAFRVWGGRVIVISTEDDDENIFHKLVEDIRNGVGVRSNYSLHEYTLIDAVNDGLYRRVCLVGGKQWSQEAEEAWVADLLASEGAETEFLCIPRKSGATGMVFRPREWCEFVDELPLPAHVTKSVRAWDRAATKPHKANKDPDWTRGVKIVWTNDGGIWIVDGIGMRDTPGAVTEAIVGAARADGIGTTVALWQDPGSAGKFEAEAMLRALEGRHVHVEVAAEAKHTYWKPIASTMRQRHGVSPIKIVRGAWTDDFCSELSRCPNGKHDDWADALALAWLAGAGVAEKFELHTMPRRRSVSL